MTCVGPLVYYRDDEMEGGLVDFGGELILGQCEQDHRCAQGETLKLRNKISE